MRNQSTTTLIKFTSLILGMVVIAIVYSSFVISVPKVSAAVGDIGHWQDSAGSQIPGTTFAGFNFASQQRNDNTTYSKPSDSTIEIEEAGDFLIIGTVHYSDSSNGRFGPQARCNVTTGSGTLFTSYYTGYSRDNSENEAWTKFVCYYDGGSANDQIQIQVRSDSDLPIGGSVINTSDVQIVRMNPTNVGIYAIGGTTGALSGTTPNTVDVTAASFETDTAAIEGNVSTETITVKGDNKRYLVAWSVSGDTGGTRTQRVGHLEYDGTDDLATRSYCYQRQASDEYCGLGSMDIIETVTSDIAIQVEVWQGDGILADEGGAENSGSFDTDGNGQMVVLELPDSVEVFRSHDATGVQDITSAVTLNAMRNVDFNDSASFTQSSVAAMDVTAAADVFTWANVWTARLTVSSGSRLTALGSITVNAVEQSVGTHGNYVRGLQSSSDTFAGSFHPGGIYAVGTAGHDIGVNMDPLSGTEGGGADRTQAGTVGFFAINLDTLAAADSAPTVDTDAATGVTVSSATLNGDITVTGGSNATVRGFAYGTASDLSTTIATTTESGSFGTGTFSQNISSLLAGVTYYFRAYATNPTGTGYGSILNFTAGTDTTPTRRMRLFEGFTIKLIGNTIILYGQ